MKPPLLFLACLLLCASPWASASDLGDRVVAFCTDHLGQQVGNGECAELAGHALKDAGAKIHSGPDAPGPGDYVWGKQVLLVEAGPDGPTLTGDLADVEPGDIIQYRDTKFITAHFDHHSSVVSSVDLATRKVRVYQQNIGGKRIVMEGLVQLNNLKEGWLRIYRPIRN